MAWLTVTRGYSYDGNQYCNRFRFTNPRMYRTVDELQPLHRHMGIAEVSGEVDVFQQVLMTSQEDMLRFFYNLFLGMYVLRDFVNKRVLHHDSNRKW